MFGTLKRSFHRWMAVDEYDTDQKIFRALEWILGQGTDHRNYRALLKVFIEDSPSSSLNITASERAALLGCLEKADCGGTITAAELPRIASREGQLSMGRWLTNACRRDLGLMPRDADHVIPISCYCDDATCRVIVSTFRALGYSGGSELGGLRAVATKARVRTWIELLPFVVGPCLASCGAPLSFPDALLLPPTGSSFFYKARLGAVHILHANTVVVRVAAMREVASRLTPAITQPLQGSDVLREVKRAGWEGQTLL